MKGVLLGFLGKNELYIIIILIYGLTMHKMKLMHEIHPIKK